MPSRSDTTTHTSSNNTITQKDMSMASYKPETSCSADVVPFFLNKAEYVGFFLKVNPQTNNFSTLIIKRKDFDSQAEFMKNLAAIYDSCVK